MKSKQYRVKVGLQGNAVVSDYGYVSKESDNIILLYVDARGATGRAYPDGTSTIVDSTGAVGVPEIWLSVSEDDDTATTISFPELAGWEVFCVNGGKTLSIALQKGRGFED
jgi:hypothetical protein